MYSISCCGMIAMKREVAGYAKVYTGFSVERMSSRIWRQVTVRNLRSIDADRNDVRVSHEHLEGMPSSCECLEDTHGRVYSHHLSY